MKTYRDAFAVAEFTPLFVATSLRGAAQTMSGLALATLVYGRTGSPLLSALSMFGASFAQVLGALTLLASADRVRPRAALMVLGTIFSVATFALSIPGIPVWALLLIELATGLPSAAQGGVQWGLVNEILPEGGYILGRSIFNMSVGVTQIVGFAAGGALLTLVPARGALMIAGALYALSVAFVRIGLADRPARATGRATARESWAGTARLWSDPARRTTYLALWVPNGLIVGCEALFVPYAPHRAGVLFAAAGLGMLAGDTLVGRWLPGRWRGRLITPLRLLLAAPYLLFAVHPGLGAALALAGVASLGYGAGLLLQERLIALTPEPMAGQALGLHSSGMLTMQAVGATLAGAVSEQATPAAAMAIMAAASLAVTLALTPGLSASPRVDVFPGRASG